MELFKPKLGLKQKIAFFRLLSVSQKAGLGIREALLAIRHSERNTTMIEVLNDLITKTSEWADLSSAMGRHKEFFSTGEIELVKSAQLTGNLVGTLDDIFKELETTAEINKKIKKATTYPTMLILFSAGAVIALVTYAIPGIVALFPPEAIPPLTKFVLKMGDFMKTRWYWIIGVIAWVVFLFKYLHKNVLSFRIMLDNLFLRAPVISEVIRNYYMYRFSKLLGQFYKAWLNPVVSLGLIANILSNVNYKRKVYQVKKDIEWGFTFYESLEWSPLFDPILTQIIHVGEETGSTGDVMNNISAFYEDELKLKIDMLMTIIEPLIIVFVAAIIGVIMMSVFLPMTQIMSVIA